MWVSNTFPDYELLDTSDGQRLERWKDIILIRPDPQVIWKDTRKSPFWSKADARYIRSKSGGGRWEGSMPESWNIDVSDYKFLIKPMGFKHTGLFPEQAVNWNYIDEKIRNADREIKVLNLFAYTGGASVAAAKAGAKVCHVDASKGMVAQAKENAALSNVSDTSIRYIVDDCFKFVKREIRRNNKYDAIIMDPPSYGRGPDGELWKLEDSIFSFLTLVKEVLSDDPLFFILNSYTTGLSGHTMAYMLNMTMRDFKGKTTCDELGLRVKETSFVLPCGACARWNAE